MKFVKSRDFAMYHDCTDGESVGWTVTFNLHYTKRRGNVAQVWATSPTGRVIRDPHKVSRIMPVEDWPEFARSALDNTVKGTNTEEGLF